MKRRKSKTTECFLFTQTLACPLEQPSYFTYFTYFSNPGNFELVREKIRDEIFGVKLIRKIRKIRRLFWQARKLGRMIAKHNGRVYGRYKIHYRPDRHDYWLQEMPEHAEKARNT